MSTATVEILRYSLALLRTPSVGPRTFARLMRVFSDFSEIFDKKNKKHLEKLLSESAVHYLANPDWSAVEQDLKWALEPDHHLISLQDSRYPALLREISDPPIILYIRGKLEVLHTLQIGMVGSRNPSFLGRENAFQLAYQLAHKGITITSGLARGIDGCSHQGALAAEGQTIAVLGSGLNRLYPKQHAAMAEMIPIKGALVSEFPLETPPLAKHFPQRNRIISGLSRGVLIVEAAMQSGSLVTARLANEQGREVFAVPGSIHNALAKGCHYLIREGAKLVDTANDVLEELGFLVTPVAEKKWIAVPSFNARERKIWNCLDYEPLSMDSIVLDSGLTISDVSSILLSFEANGLIRATQAGYLKVA
jgi:DNA processing protein